MTNPGPKPKLLADRFWSKVDKNGPTPAHCPEIGPCWLWTGSKSGNGYGKIGSGGHAGKTLDAHRVSFFLHHGRWPEPEALHASDNKQCVRPEHISEGTRLENARDRVAKGRAARGVSHGHSKLTEADVLAIFRSNELHRVLAARFGVVQSVIWAIKSGRRWSHVTAAVGGSTSTSSTVDSHEATSSMPTDDAQ